jgi:LCP family protein required for cell wall assembly
MHEPVKPTIPDPQAETQPSRTDAPLHYYQAVPVDRYGPIPAARTRHLPHLPWAFVLLLGAMALYLFFPARTNILVMGIDNSPQRGELGRTDTLILATFNPGKGYVGMLSIPRDLYVLVPGVGEDRINTAYFYAEANQKGTGPAAAVETVHQNFGVTVHYNVVINMSNIVDVFDAMGGLDIHLDEPMGGLPAGDHHLDGTQALAFARERYSADDFSRMRQGQIVIKAAIARLINPFNWWRMPLVTTALVRTMDIHVPVILWPRLAAALLRTGVKGIDSRVITREMVFPFQTNTGAQVLGPNWDAINPVLLEMFGE